MVILALIVCFLFESPGWATIISLFSGHPGWALIFLFIYKLMTIKQLLLNYRIITVPFDLSTQNIVY